MMQRTTAVQSVAMHLRTASAYLYTRLIAMPMSVLHATTATASGLSYPSKKPSPACALLGLGTRKKAVTCGERRPRCSRVWPRLQWQGDGERVERGPVGPAYIAHPSRLYLGRISAVSRPSHVERSSARVQH